MDKLSLVLVILGGLVLVWALLILLFGGDKYMKWCLGNEDESKYDKKKLKIVHVSFLAFIGIWAVLAGLIESNSQTLLIILSVGTIVIASFFRLTKK